MVSSPTGLSGSRRTCFSRRRSVHRRLPSGAGPKAILIISASALPSAFLRAFDFGLRLESQALTARRCGCCRAGDCGKRENAVRVSPPQAGYPAEPDIKKIPNRFFCRMGVRAEGMIFKAAFLNITIGKAQIACAK